MRWLSFVVPALRCPMGEPLCFAVGDLVRVLSGDQHGRSGSISSTEMLNGRQRFYVAIPGVGVSGSYVAADLDAVGFAERRREPGDCALCGSREPLPGRDHLLAGNDRSFVRCSASGEIPGPELPGLLRRAIGVVSDLQRLEPEIRAVLDCYAGKGGPDPRGPFACTHEGADRVWRATAHACGRSLPTACGFCALRCGHRGPCGAAGQ